MSTLYATDLIPYVSGASNGWGYVSDLYIFCTNLWGYMQAKYMLGIQSDQYVPSEGMVLKYQHSLRWQPRCWASSWPLVIPGAMDIGTDPGYGRVTDLDLALGSSGRGSTMALGSSTGHPHLCIEFIGLFFLQQA